MSELLLNFETYHFIFIFLLNAFSENVIISKDEYESFNHNSFKF